LAQHGHKELEPAELRMLGSKGERIAMWGLLAAVVGLVLTLVSIPLSAGGVQHFFHAYLVNYSFFLTLSLGALAFILFQHLFRGGWSVVVRRVPEVVAANMGVLFVLFVPVIITVAIQSGVLYDWVEEINSADDSYAAATYEPADMGQDFQIVLAENKHGTHAHVEKPDRDHHDDHDHAAEEAMATTAPHDHGDEDHAEGDDHDDHHGHSHDDDHDHAHHGAAHAGHHDAHGGDHGKHPNPLVTGKEPFLNPTFFVIRCIFYFVVWYWMAKWYLARSVEQDETGDGNLTLRMQVRAPFMVLLFALVTTFAMVDLLISLSPVWFSTMWGVYVFAGSFLSCMAMMALVYHRLQSGGLVPTSITTEHYHDIGKLMFAFVFFWSYVAFSQYMLYAYASIPEHVFWYADRGASADTLHIVDNSWAWVSLLLLFGHALIPFPLLLSRHVKRNKLALQLLAVWILVFHWIDLYWMIMPELSLGFTGLSDLQGKTTLQFMPFGLMELGTFLLIGGICLWACTKRLSKHSLIPPRDPRLNESLAFENI